MEEYSDRSPADIVRYPMVPIRDVVIFPFTKVAFKIGRAGSVRALEEAIRAMPEVVACHYISGAGTFELHVVATDLDAYARWSLDILFKLPNVKDLHTSFSLGEVKASAALPLGHLGAR